HFADLAGAGPLLLLVGANLVLVRDLLGNHFTDLHGAGPLFGLGHAHLVGVRNLLGDHFADLAGAGPLLLLVGANLVGVGHLLFDHAGHLHLTGAGFRTAERDLILVRNLFGYELVDRVGHFLLNDVRLPDAASPRRATGVTRIGRAGLLDPAALIDADRPRLLNRHATADVTGCGSRFRHRNLDRVLLLDRLG